MYTLISGIEDIMSLCLSCALSMRRPQAPKQSQHLFECQLTHLLRPRACCVSLPGPPPHSCVMIIKMPRRTTKRPALVSYWKREGKKCVRIRWGCVFSFLFSRWRPEQARVKIIELLFNCGLELSLSLVICGIEPAGKSRFKLRSIPPKLLHWYLSACYVNKQLID